MSNKSCLQIDSNPRIVLDENPGQRFSMLDRSATSTSSKLDFVYTFALCVRASAEIHLGPDGTRLKQNAEARHVFSVCASAEIHLGPDGTRLEQNAEARHVRSVCASVEIHLGPGS